MPEKVLQGVVGEDAVIDRMALTFIFNRLRERGYTVYGTVNEKGTGLFRPLGDLSDLSLRCTGGTLPPKHIWYKPFETLFAYDRVRNHFKADVPPVKQAVFGIRPCDVHALLALDEVFLGGGYPDPYYWARRVELVLVVFNCVEAGDTCFCSSMGTGPGLGHDYDLLFTELLRKDGASGRERYLIEIGSSAGGELVQGLKGEEAKQEDHQEKRRRLTGAGQGNRFTLETDRLPRLMQEGYKHPYWEEITNKCFACANCTSVCPTCYCADIFDETDFNLRETRRKRRWSWCFLVEFAAVHGGNYREKHIDRLRQFMQHKLNFSIGQHGFFHCVGCGRCIVWCPANIDIAQTGRVIRGDA
ncbi:MAG: 4Fe-4S dicluster domain-containing protein [Bacillota bacterium]|nr:4Fe-4S dicluster domain-containing protein [Bacillota bacterium]